MLQHTLLIWIGITSILFLQIVSLELDITSLECCLIDSVSYVTFSNTKDGINMLKQNAFS